MPFDWVEYLDLAQFLSQGKRGFSQEAAFRCAVSRAYYAAFCHARNYARDRRNFAPKHSVEDHRDLVDQYKRDISEVANWLDMLRQWRNSCDYDDTVDNLGQIHPFAIVAAQDVFDKLT